LKQHQTTEKMNLNERIEAFILLGKFMDQFTSKGIVKDHSLPFEDHYFEAFKMQINRAFELNGWFSEENVLFAFESWAGSLKRENLNKWLDSYCASFKNESKTVAIIMAGNIPLVGFHDFLSVLVCGHKASIKLSSNDAHFLPLIVQFLKDNFPYFKDKINISREKLESYDAVIATGSNNTSRYFEHYFSDVPHIIRKNRNSVAVLKGNETQEELEKLGVDIFQYFGLGCRSVSKLYVPENYDFDKLFKALYKFKGIINYKKYENNYDYNKAVYLMSLFPLLENGFIMLKEDKSMASPIASLFYEYYSSTEDLHKELGVKSDEIQCIVSKENVVDFVKFGETQQPKLWNYADDVDTIEFLLKL